MLCVGLPEGTSERSQVACVHLIVLPPLFIAGTGKLLLCKKLHTQSAGIRGGGCEQQLHLEQQQLFFCPVQHLLPSLPASLPASVPAFLL